MSILSLTQNRDNMLLMILNHGLSALIIIVEEYY